MKKILIVDDQPEVRELVRVTLEIGPYDLHTASRGREAVEKTRELMPDLVLLDVQMPGGMDGFDVTRTLRADPLTHDIYIIMLTAKGQDFDIDVGYEAGCDDYIPKPFSPLDLMRKVEEILS